MGITSAQKSHIYYDPRIDGDFAGMVVQSKTRLVAKHTMDL